MTLESEVIAALTRARGAAPRMALATTAEKNSALKKLAGAIRASAAKVIAANQKDLKRASEDGRTGAFVERLTLNPARIEAMAHSVEEVVALPDPVGGVIERSTRPNGLDISKVRVPLGVIAMIYESRPNVTIDAGALCFKAGNAAVLRGGKEALETNAYLADLIGAALSDSGLNPDAVTFIRNVDREVIQIMKRQTELIDLVIPRGGKALKDALRGSSVPILPHFDGLCHTYVDRAADLKMALEICVDAKCSRPSVCNAMETLLVHTGVVDSFLPRLAARMASHQVELRGCARTLAILKNARSATEQDWDTEYLDLILAIK